MKPLHKRSFAGLIFLAFLISTASAQTNAKKNSSSLYWKLVDAQHYADRLIYRFDDVNVDTSNEFLRQSTMLDFVNLKFQVDSIRSELVDRDMYEDLFIRFPMRFDSYLNKYLIPQIAKEIEKAVKNMECNNVLLALTEAETSINLIDAALLIRPKNNTLVSYRQKSLEIIDRLNRSQKSDKLTKN